MVSDVFSIVFEFLFILCLMGGVAFFTLLEQKGLSIMQIRVGPNNVGFMGLLQPVADGLKLFSKENMNMKWGSSFLYNISPIFFLFFMLMIWFLRDGSLSEEMMFGVLFFFCVSGLGSFPILLSGWSSNNKYSLLGSIRSIAQMISYEGLMMVVLLSMFCYYSEFNFDILMNIQCYSFNLIFFFFLSFMWMVSIFAEVNRTPFDFSEGESELVSGFNTEYGSYNFVYFSLSEYGMILFMSYITSMIFSFFFLFFFYLFIWVRGTYARFRYDKLMNLVWFRFLLVSLILFGLYYFFSLF